MIPLVVGMPVYKRAWIMDAWFDSLEAQNPPSNTRLIFGMSYDENGRDPDGTTQIIERRWPTAEIIDMPGYGYTDAERDNDSRYTYLANIRNRLLRIMGSLDPLHYLSWDSDIILRPGALQALREPAQDAVGALVDMGGTQRPGNWSWMVLRGDDAYRPGGISRSRGTPVYATTSPSHGTELDPFQVGVIMGCKLMSPAAYKNTRYADHILGEDVGWAIQCEHMGIERWIAPQARGEHRWRI